MLVELAVSNLGVIDELSLVLGPGMTAITGETGAGKTLVVGAIELLTGVRSDPSVVRPGAGEAVVEGRFDLGGEELVLSRVIPPGGRSRAYVNGRLATAAALAEQAAPLVELHGQHAQVALLGPASQRRALDRYGSVDVEALRSARARLAAADEDLAALTGGGAGREREIDFLRYQLAELDGAGIDDPGEDERLAAREALLADAEGHRAAAGAAARSLGADGGAGEQVGVAAAALAGRAPLAPQAGRLPALGAELADLAAELRALADQIESDPAQLGEIQARRALLGQLRRRYAPGAGGRTGGRAGSLADLVAVREELRGRLDTLESAGTRIEAAEGERAAAAEALRLAAAAVGAARRRASAPLAATVQARLRQLGLGRARFAVEVGDGDPGDDVAFLLAANAGLPAAPLARVASGGELARTMLAVRLILTESAPTLVFDEVDAGVGGAAARTVGRALAELAADRQVLVVTHLPQVAAFADAQVALTKAETRASTVVRAEVVAGPARVVELSRMLSGLSASGTARDHAEELLVTAARERRR